MKHGLYPMNIQLFADEAGEDTSGSGQEGKPDNNANPTPEGAPEGNTQPNSGGKQFTQEDVNRLITERLERQQKKFDASLEERLSEAQKLAKMNAEEKAKYEREQADAKLAEREAEITRRELIAQAKEGLASKGLPLELADCGVYTSADACQKSMNAVEKAFRTAVEKAVNDRMRGTPPKVGSANPPNTETMTYTELAQYMEQNPGVEI